MCTAVDHIRMHTHFVSKCQDTDNLAEAEVQMSPNEVVLYGGGTTIVPYAVDPLRACGATVIALALPQLKLDILPRPPVPFQRSAALLSVVGLFASLGIILAVVLAVLFRKYQHQLVCPQCICPRASAAQH